MVKKTTLRNGIRIISEEMPEVNSANLGIWVKTGSRNEQLSENGVSHFVEHLLFKGTPTYSAKDISSPGRIGRQIMLLLQKSTFVIILEYCTNFFEHLRSF